MATASLPYETFPWDDRTAADSDGTVSNYIVSCHIIIKTGKFVSLTAKIACVEYMYSGPCIYKPPVEQENVVLY